MRTQCCACACVRACAFLLSTFETADWFFKKKKKYETYAVGGFPKFVYFNFIQSVMTIWQTHLLVRWDMVPWFKQLFVLSRGVGWNGDDMLLFFFINECPYNRRKRRWKADVVSRLKQLSLTLKKTRKTKLVCTCRELTRCIMLRLCLVNRFLRWGHLLERVSREFCNTLY